MCRDIEPPAVAGGFGLRFGPKGLIDDDLPGAVGLLFHYFDAFGADLYFIAIDNTPFRPAEGDITGAQAIHCLNLHFSLDREDRFYRLFEFLFAGDGGPWFGNEDAGDIVHTHDGVYIAGVESFCQGCVCVFWSCW